MVNLKEMQNIWKIDLKIKLWTLLTILCLLGKLEGRWQSDRYAYGML